MLHIEEKDLRRLLAEAFELGFHGSFDLCENVVEELLDEVISLQKPEPAPANQFVSSGPFSPAPANQFVSSGPFSSGWTVVSTPNHPTLSPPSSDSPRPSISIQPPVPPTINVSMAPLEIMASQMSPNPSDRRTWPVQQPQAQQPNRNGDVFQHRDIELNVESVYISHHSNEAMSQMIAQEDQRIIDQVQAEPPPTTSADVDFM